MSVCNSPFISQPEQHEQLECPIVMCYCELRRENCFTLFMVRFPGLLYTLQQTGFCLFPSIKTALFIVTKELHGSRGQKPCWMSYYPIWILTNNQPYCLLYHQHFMNFPLPFQPLILVSFMKLPILTPLSLNGNVSHSSLFKYLIFFPYVSSTFCPQCLSPMCYWALFYGLEIFTKQFFCVYYWLLLICIFKWNSLFLWLKQHLFFKSTSNLMCNQQSLFSNFFHPVQSYNHSFSSGSH